MSQIDIDGGDGETGGRRDWTSEDVVNDDNGSNAPSEGGDEPLVDVDDFTDDEEEEPVEKDEIPSQLQQALDNCDLRGLKKLLKMADDLDMDDAIISDCAVYLERCNVIKKELISIVNGKKGEDLLIAAIQKAKEIPNFQSDVLEGAKLALARLRGGGNIDVDIDNAMANCELEELNRLLELATSIEFDGDIVIAGRAFYEKVLKITHSLEDAAKHNRGGELEEAIEDAKQITNFHAESLALAEETLAKLMADEGGDHAALLDALAVALSHGNVEAIRPLVQKANDFGVRGSTVLSKASKVIRVSDMLTAALKDRSAKQIQEGLVLAKGVADVKLSIVTQAEKQQQRIEMEEPVIKLLKNALEVKKLTLLIEAIDAAEELDREMFKMVEMELALERTKESGEVAPQRGSIVPEKLKIEVVDESAKLTGVEARRAKALAKHVNRQEASRKDDGAARIKYEKFNPPELELCKDLRIIITRVENDLSSAIKRCAHDKHLPDILKECNEIGLKSKIVLKASSLLFRALKAKQGMTQALKEARISGTSDARELLEATTYAKTKVHDRFMDPIMDECVVEIKRMEEMKRHEDWIRYLTAATEGAPLYYSTGNSGKAPPGMLRRRSSRGSFTERSDSFTEDVVRRRSTVTGKNPGPPRRKSSFSEDIGTPSKRGSQIEGNTPKRGSLSDTKRGSLSDPRRGSLSDSRRLSFSESFTEKRNSMNVVDPSLLALSLDSLLRNAIDEATETDIPVYGQFLTTEHVLILKAEKCLKKRELLRDGLASLLTIHEHDSADPKTAAKYIEKAKLALSQLAELEELSATNEQLIIARIAEATIKDDAEVVKDLIGQLSSKESPILPAAMSPPPIPEDVKRKGDNDQEGGGGGGLFGDGEEKEPDDYVKTTGCTLMHYAALHGAVNAGRILAAKYGSHFMTQQDDRGWSPIHIASMRGRYSFIEMAIQTIAGSNAADTVSSMIISTADHAGRTPLHLACFYGRPLTAKWLIEQGASTEVLDKNGRSAVNCARERGHAGLAADLKRLLTE